ncbi:MAG: DUF2520 domain-containing protein [Balneolaceae bacterium]|nr:MAG: DUF2520 domain-containing protein [Balneolaceae bacterium]
MNLQKPRVTVIGTGAVGGALIVFFRESSHYHLHSIWNSSHGILFDESGAERKIQSSLPSSEDQVGDLLFLAVPDDAISNVAAALASNGLNWTGKHVVHCSGNLSSEALKALLDVGCSTASMHPIQTFKKGDEANRFRGIYVSLEGNSSLIKILEVLVKNLGANSISLSRYQKSILHLAAVLSSNYLVALMNQTEKILKKAELNEGISLLEPLISQTAQNIKEKGTVDALTGPISRGDVNSVQKHLELIKGDLTSKELYKVMGRIAIEITLQRNEVPPGKLQQMRDLLNEQ